MTEPTQPTEPTPPAPSAIDELEAWKQRHGVDFLIVAVSPWGKMAPIAFLLPDGFDVQVQVIKAEQAK